MLAIRLQRTGRKGHAQFRVIVQDAHRSPASGKVVKYIGNYDPHTKAVTIDKEKAAHFLEHGAQPSPRVAYLLSKEGVKLPDWVKLETDKKKSIKHTEKLRRNRTEDEKTSEEPKAEEVKEEAKTEEPTANETADETVEAEETTTPVEEPAIEPEAPAEATEPEVPADEAKAE